MWLSASEKVVVTKKPEAELNALILATMGVSDRNAAAWDSFQSSSRSPRTCWTDPPRKREDQIAPAGWPEGSSWPFDFGDAVRKTVPEVVMALASESLATLRSSGYFDRLRQVRLGDTPVMLVNTGQASMFDFLLPELGRARVAARMNAYRMRHALNQGDEQEFLEAVRDNRFLAQIVSQEFLIVVLWDTRWTLRRWSRFASRSWSIASRRRRSGRSMRSVRTCDPRSVMKFAVKAERIGQQDMIQRLFTDDGKGNGHIAPAPN